MNIAQRIVILATAVVVAGLVLFGPTPVISSESYTVQAESPNRNEWVAVGTRIHESYGPRLSPNGWRILATLVLGGALVAVLHKRKQPGPPSPGG